MNIYRTITDRILSQLESGQLPWRRTWQEGLPANLATGNEYRGINVLMLGTTEYRSRYWVTYRQALALGGHVRKGERATQVVFWKWRSPEELEAAKAKNGGKTLPQCYPFTSSVFNLDQLDGVERPEADVHHRLHRRLEIADQVIGVMPHRPEISHALSHHPAYDCAADRVLLPHLSQFESADAYFATLFHELVHSTGHPRRLDRFRREEGDRHQRYSFDELVAEIGAAFLCGFCGITNPDIQQLQSSYVAGWAEVFRKDVRILLRAASAAQRAADYIRGKVVDAQASGPTKEAASDG